jgi:hypothetical protein
VVFIKKIKIHFFQIPEPIVLDNLKSTRFLKHALLARAFPTPGQSGVGRLVHGFGGSVLAGRRDNYSGCELLIERKCCRFIRKCSLSQTSQRFLSELKDVVFYV